MDIFFILIIAMVLSFGFVVFFGAPYLPTLTPQVKAALKLADLKPGDHLLELGCGDGKVLIAAAKQGIHVTGYELNPLLVIISWLRTVRYRKLVKIVWGNFWQVDLPKADAIFVFLLPKYMTRLDTKIVQEQKRWCSNLSLPTAKPVNPASAGASWVKLISFAFTIRGKVVDGEKDGVYLYNYR
jgi:SAM-dependent methyltransferase